MTKPELMQLMRTLSALESWSWAVKEPIPSWLTEQVAEGVVLLERDIMKPDINWPEQKGPMP